VGGRGVGIVLQCVAVWYSVVQCIAVMASHWRMSPVTHMNMSCHTYEDRVRTHQHKRHV